MDNPLFEGFAIDSAPSTIGRESIEEDIEPRFEPTRHNRPAKPVFLGGTWNAPSVRGRVAPYHDFPAVLGSLPVFSRRACDALRDLLVPNGELLPLIAAQGEYLFFNITTFLDAIDLTASTCTTPTNTPLDPFDIERFAFHEESLSGHAIFRLTQCPVMTVVTDEFVARAKASHLHGFDFNQIWPMGIGENWQEEARRKKRNSDARRLKQHTVVIRLFLDADAPTPSEMLRIEAFEDRLDALLAISSLDAPYHGRYEGNDLVPNEFRLFLSAPDAEALAKMILEPVNGLNWPRKILLTTRHGEMWEYNARETTVRIQ
jgi:hypothetical protein